MEALRLRVIAVGIVSITLSLLARPALAQQTTNEARARALFSQGEDFHSRGDYASAIRRYEKAYSLMPLPLLLFDLAQAHRLNHEQWQSHRLLRAVSEGRSAWPGC